MGLLEATMGGLGYAGDVMDKVGGRAIRGGLAGKARELASVVPFSDTLGLTDYKDRTSGRGALDALGITSKQDDSLLAGVLGFGTELATDPLNWGMLGLGGHTLAKAHGMSLGEGARTLAGHGRDFARNQTYPSSLLGMTVHPGGLLDIAHDTLSPAGLRRFADQGEIRGLGLGPYPEAAAATKRFLKDEGGWMKVPPWGGRTDVSSELRAGADAVGPLYEGGSEKLADVLKPVRSPSTQWGGMSEAMLRSPDMERIAGEIPEGSKFLGHGSEAVALAAPDGHVIRLGPAESSFGSTGRAHMPEILQPFRSIHLPDWQIEHLPRVRPLRPSRAEANEFARYLDHLRALDKRGWSPEQLEDHRLMVEAARDAHLGPINQANRVGNALRNQVEAHHPDLDAWDFHGGNVAVTPEGKLIGHDGGMVRGRSQVPRYGGVPGRGPIPPPFTAAYPAPDQLSEILRRGGPEAIREAMAAGLAEGTVGQGVDLPGFYGPGMQRDFAHYDQFMKAQGLQFPPDYQTPTGPSLNILGSTAVPAMSPWSLPGFPAAAPKPPSTSVPHVAPPPPVPFDFSGSMNARYAAQQAQAAHPGGAGMSSWHDPGGSRSSWSQFPGAAGPAAGAFPSGRSGVSADSAPWLAGRPMNTEELDALGARNPPLAPPDPSTRVPATRPGGGPPNTSALIAAQVAAFLKQEGGAARFNLPKIQAALGAAGTTLADFLKDERGSLHLKYDHLVDPPATSLVRSDPEWANNRTFFHGTVAPGLTPETLDPTKTSPFSLFGRGIYTTDEGANSGLRVTRGYARARAHDQQDLLRGFQQRELEALFKSPEGKAAEARTAELAKTYLLGQHLGPADSTAPASQFLEFLRHLTRQATPVRYSRAQIDGAQAAFTEMRQASGMVDLEEEILRRMPVISPPTIYQSQSNFGKILDLDAPVGRPLANAMHEARSLMTDRAGGNPDQWLQIPSHRAIDALAEPGQGTRNSALLEQLLAGDRHFRDEYHRATVPAMTGEPIIEALRGHGFDALTHTGGLRTRAGRSGAPHQVMIGLDPNDTISKVGRAGGYKLWEAIKGFTQDESGAARFRAKGTAPYSPEQVHALTGKAGTHLDFDEATAAYQSWIDGLTPEERTAVKLYTSGPQARISHTLRGGSTTAGGKPIDVFDELFNSNYAFPGTTPLESPEDVRREVIPYLDSALSRSSAPKDAMTYRSANQIGGLTPENAKTMLGQTVSDPSYLSTTINPWGRFYGNNANPSGLILDILHPHGAQGGFADAISSWAKEKELILPRSAPLAVRDVRQVPVEKINHDWHRLDAAGKPMPQPGTSGGGLFADNASEKFYGERWGNDGPPTGGVVRQGAYGEHVVVPDELMSPDWRGYRERHFQSEGQQTNVLLEQLREGAIPPHQAAVGRMPPDEVWAELQRRAAQPRTLTIPKWAGTTKKKFLVDLARDAKRFKGEYPDWGHFKNLEQMGLTGTDLLRSRPLHELAQFLKGDQGFLKVPIPGVAPELAQAMDGLGPQYEGGINKLKDLAQSITTQRAANSSPDQLRNRILALAHDTPHAAQLAGEIPEGTQYLGGGMEGLAFKAPDGHVIRIGDLPRQAVRADLPEMLQAVRETQVGPYKVEHMPQVAPMEGGFEPAVRSTWPSGLRNDLPAGFNNAIRADSDMSWEADKLARMMRDNLETHANPWDVSPHNLGLTAEGKAIVYDGGAIREHPFAGMGDPSPPSFPPKPTFAAPEGDLLRQVLAAGGPEKVRESIRQGLAAGTQGQGVDMPQLAEILHQRSLIQDYLRSHGLDPGAVLGVPEDLATRADRLRTEAARLGSPPSPGSSWSWDVVAPPANPRPGGISLKQYFGMTGLAAGGGYLAHYLLNHKHRN